MGEKGSIKNLYKSWRLFLEDKKKKKKLKIKKNSKSKVFVITFFTLLLSPFFFTPKNSKKAKKQIDLLILEIEKEDNPEILTELKKEIQKEKKKIINKVPTPKKELDNIVKAEEIIDKKLEHLKKEDNHIIEEKHKEKINEIEPIFIFKNKKELNKSSVKKNSLKDPEIIEFLNYMRLEINTIESKLKENLTLFQLKNLKSKIIELDYRRKNFKENYEFSNLIDMYSSKDKYNLFKNNETLENLYKNCDLKMDSLNETEEKKDKKLKKINFDLLEIKKINIYLEKEIKKQNNLISKLKLDISKIDKKLYKSNLIKNIKNLLQNAIKICLDLLPLTFIKNRLGKSLLSAFLLNNSIRGIRNLISEEKIEYAKLLNNINNQKDLIFNTRLVYEDAITQIEFLKYDLLSKFSFTDLKEIFTKIYDMEEEIKRKNKILSDLEMELEQNYLETRNKSKILER